MAKKSSVEKNNHRKALVKKFAGRRARSLKAADQRNGSSTGLGCERKPCACAVPSSVRPVWRGELPFDKGAAL